MVVMPANNSKGIVHYWSGVYPGALGHLYSPNGFRGPYDWLPYALDNGAFPAFTNGVPWDESAFLALCRKAAQAAHRPRWIVVPDVVGSRDDTLRSWDRWSTYLAATFEFPLAMAVQDGMLPADVSSDAVVVFVGGTTDWKWDNLPQWTQAFARVHVGRVNWATQLWKCHELGVESVDGTGWFRGGPERYAGLAQYLKETHAGR